MKTIDRGAVNKLLATRSVGPGTGWTTIHMGFEQEATAELKHWDHWGQHRS